MLCFSVTVKQELKDHVVAAKGMFLFRYSVKVHVLLVECEENAAIPFKEEKICCIFSVLLRF
jgi:hypothetical protein